MTIQLHGRKGKPKKKSSHKRTGGVDEKNERKKQIKQGNPSTKRMHIAQQQHTK